MDPISRRSLLGAGVGAAVGLNATTAPAAAREIDPALVSHWMQMLPHDLLDHGAQSDHLTLWDDLGRKDDGAPPYVLADEARCWLRLRPGHAIAMLEDVLRAWPQDRPRGRGIHQARLALACAAGDEPERAAVEGIRALDIARDTRSDITMRELKQLDRRLAAYDVPAATDFREALAAL